MTYSWADAESLQVISSLAQDNASTNALIVCAFREETKQKLEAFLESSLCKNRIFALKTSILCESQCGDAS